MELNIKEILDITESNIEINGLCKKNINNIISKVISAKLVPTEKCCCDYCGSTKTIKWGFKTTLITMPKIMGYDTYLELTKQRYFCNKCKKTFLAKTKIVDKKCHISNSTKLLVAVRLKDKISVMDIAKQHNLSKNIVMKVLMKYYKEYTSNKNVLPKVLCFDEFKSVKGSAGAMSFIFCDPEKKDIIDILEDRRLNKLREYFSRYTIKARNNVENVVIDMYSPYISLIKEMFPNAKISIDRFHLVQLINRSFNKTRIKKMNEYKKDKPFYNKLKRYWKLLLKNSVELGTVREYYHRLFKKNISESEIVDYILDYDKDLAKAYETYQNFLYAIKKKNLTIFKKELEKNNDNNSDYMKVSIKTFKKYFSYIENSLTFQWNNGIIESINNKIKVIKRIAFGFRSFVNFRSRILIASNLMKGI